MAKQNIINTINYPLILGVIVFIASNAYFGWNATAQSTAERAFDTLWGTLIVWGILRDLASKITWNYHYNITTKNTHIEQK